MAASAENRNRATNLLMAAGSVNARRGRIAPSTALALKQAGLEYLLFDEAHARALGSLIEASAPEFFAPVSRAPERTPRPASARAQEVSPAGTTEKPRAGEVPASASASAVWPEAWAALLKKTRAAPVLWTYLELGRDICGAPDPRRREFLREILRELAHPAGTHSFWPVALPAGSEGELQPETALFWEGARRLKSRAVVVMGSGALRALGLPPKLRGLRPFMQARLEGRLLIVLPSPEASEEEPQRMNALREFLRRALEPFAQGRETGKA